MFRDTYAPPLQDRLTVMAHCRKCHNWWFDVVITRMGRILDLPADIIQDDRGGKLWHQGVVRYCGGEVILLRMSLGGERFNRDFLP